MATLDGDTNSVVVTAVCASCGAPQTTFRRCGKCRLVLYCNRACQIAHWSTHKAVCGEAGSLTDIMKRLEAARQTNRDKMEPTMESSWVDSDRALHAASVAALKRQMNDMYGMWR